jgi:hypothetical protein
MLECNTEYGFLVSSDEMILLRFAIVQRGKKINLALVGEEPDYGWVDTTIEPQMYYSDPIKHIDVLDEERGTISVKLALLHLMHVTVMNEFKMPKEKGNCAKYFPTTEAGKKFRF